MELSAYSPQPTSGIDGTVNIVHTSVLWPSALMLSPHKVKIDHSLQANSTWTE